MQNDIFVTGIGTISAIGNDVSQTLASLKTQSSGIGEIEILQTSHKGEFKVGEVKLSNPDLMEKLNIPTTSSGKYTRTALLGLMAAKEAFHAAGLEQADNHRTGLISSTTVGGMDKTELVYQDATNSDFVLTHPCGDSTEKIAVALGVKGYRTTINTACSSGANAVMHAARLIQQGIIDRAIVGGIDALSRFTLNGFNSLMILDREFCKPFDNDRKGLNLGEGAGFIVIESADSMKKRDQKPLCRLTGYANANDAYHQTASSPEGEGAYLAMKAALEMNDIKPEEISYINVHGTGTPNNDLSEGTAIKRIFGENLPPFSSTKSFTGHTLGAAAGIEAVFSVLSIQHNLIYPNLNFTTPIENLDMQPETQLRTDKEIHHVLSNSLGFGGNTSTLIFSR